jgi:hypothetical protein
MPWEHTFDATIRRGGSSLTSQGSPYSIFKRALRSGDLARVRAAATELPRVPLDDAFAICLLILEQQPDHYERAAVRWLCRLGAERRHISLSQIWWTADCLAALADPPRACSGAAALATLGGDLGLPQLGAHLRSWKLR